VSLNCFIGLIAYIFLLFSDLLIWVLYKIDHIVSSSVSYLVAFGSVSFYN
jgi:hypothetical protein